MISRFETLALCLLLCCQGCANSREPVDDNTREVAANDTPSVPADFEMMLGEGGGFSGQWSGYTIRADGSVFAWQGPVAGVNLDSIGVLEPDSLRRIWQRVKDIGFFSQSMEEAGNITAFVRITADSMEARASWIPGVEAIQPPRHEVEALYRRTRHLANDLSR